MAWIPFAAAGAGALLSSVLNKKPSAPQQQQIDQNPWEPSIPYLNSILQQIQAYGGSPAPYSSPDQMVAGLTPEQKMAAGNVMGEAGSADQLAGQGRDALTPFLRGDYMNVDSNPYLQAATAAAIRPVTQNYQENVIPGIQSAFSTGTDAYDSSREGIARGIASRSYLDSVGDISANMANRGYETGLQATGAAINQVPGMVQAATAPGQAQWNIGALLQAQNQQQLNAPAAFDTMQQQRLQFPLNAYTQVGQIGRQGQSTMTGGQPNSYLNALGGGILGLSAYNMWPKAAAPGGTPGYNSTGMTQDNSAFLNW